MHIAAIQLCSGTDIGANLHAAEILIRAAAAKGANFIATPEMTHLMDQRREHLLRAIKPQAEDRGVAFFSTLARELHVHLLIGSLAIRINDQKAANRALLFTPDGALSAQYDKIHLFDVRISDQETWNESNIYEPGQQPVCANIDQIKIGLSICYDLRFSGLYRYYGQQAADLLAVPAAFTVPTGQAHWEILLRARAIETGAYIIAPAQGGQHMDGRYTWGHSLIVDPWGKIIAALDHDRPGFLDCIIDQTQVTQARCKIPAWSKQDSYM